MPLKKGHPCCPCGSHWLCRYAWFEYKPLFACFECRKTFKRRLPSDLEPSVRGDVTPRCPTCGSDDVKEMGIGFRPPRASRVKEWRLLAEVVREGRKFLCCCGSGQPTTILEFRALMSRPRSFEKSKKR